MLNDVNELYHHGVKGQKWGVRRYQNYDGTRIKGASNERKIHKLDNGDFEIDSKAKFYRWANSDEPLDTKRKYVSITEDDRKTYGEQIDELGIDMSKPYSEYELTSSKSLKIANGMNVTSKLIDDYGDQSLKDTLKEVQRQRDVITKLRKGELDDDYDRFEAYDFLEGTTKEGKAVRDFVADKMKTNYDDISKYYSSKGYDGIVDPEDYISMYANMPIVLLDPSKSIRKSKELVRYDLNN